ncbi:uncharacterized protein LOC135704019 [Ochlerotatus camptorhynchus]|uniref:uncharacterized protein LOC135704019 n=1 Tax=Ochlerotatus camptorhynchus TaxID=644619 RepID=UPI0031DE10B9
MVSQSIMITETNGGKKNSKSPTPPTSDPPSPGIPATNGSVYGSASEYSWRFSYSNYDLYRSVIEIALNVSFLAATSNQLRLLISFRESQDFIVSMTLVTLSLMMQLLIAIIVVTIAVNDHYRWIKLKAFTTMGAILLTVVNVVIPFVINAEHSHVDFSRIYPH